ncbi:hypothetical protein AHAS_Ahas16G0279400 [Arachis hypogaea]
MLFSCKQTKCVGDKVEFETGASKKNKVSSSRDDIDDHGNMDVNKVFSNYNFGKTEALADEMEEHSQLVDGFSSYDGVVHNAGAPGKLKDMVLFESLRRLQLMELTVDCLKLKQSEIQSLLQMRRADSTIATNLDWKEIVDEWVKATAIAGSEGIPDSVNPSVVYEEEGLPSPPMDEGAFLVASTGSIELSQFFDGMIDIGNPPQNGQNEPTVKPSRPVAADSGPGRPPKSSMQPKSNVEPKAGEEVENVKRQRTIQQMELDDLLKQGAGQRNPHFKAGNHNRHWGYEGRVGGGDWKEIVDEWVKATAIVGSEGIPDSVNPSVVYEEEGLPSPPMDEGAFLVASTGSIELSQFFDGMIDIGRFFSDPPQNGQNEPTVKPSRPVAADSGPGRPPKSSMQPKSNVEPKAGEEVENGTVTMKPPVDQQAVSKTSLHKFAKLDRL